ncbi:DNA (cytosine-5-)-methyltransferase [Kaistia granuli]|uniref:DNA (cytosine-5-)-methyltransferase n=1 Tax=Kaistia granuli TaxID=363259 RepID=UPI00038191AB|nr:DNA (cytosine-5-)-methyltransferase [Kaistia granuli]
MSEFSELRQQAGLSVAEAAQHLGYTERQCYRFEAGEGEPRKAAMAVLRLLVPAKPVEKKPSFTFIDLFAGIGGFRRAFEPLGGKCVFTSEWDRWSQATYKANYDCTDHDVAGDITKIEAKDIPEHDVLLAGFPCQPFSLAGVSKKNSLGRAHGFQCEMQGTLFFDIARIIQHHRPKAFLLENVKNLRSHDKGNTFDVIMKTLMEDLGYNVQTRIVDARHWVPQHRERIFIVGFREDSGFNFDDLEIPDAGPTLDSILHTEDGSEAHDERSLLPNGKVDPRYTLSSHLWTYLQNYAEKHRAAGNGFGFGLVGSEDIARTLSARYHKDGSEILIRQKRKNPRRLTPRECARLMGFEKRGGEPFKIVVSDTQAYRQFGNAVVAPVVEAVAKLMLPHILAKSKASKKTRKQEDKEELLSVA